MSGLIPDDFIAPAPAPREDRERGIEAYLKRRVRELGGMTRKFSSPGNRAGPDQLVMLPGSLHRMFLVETKRPGEQPTPAQAEEHDLLRRFGATVYVADTRAAVDELLISELGL